MGCSCENEVVDQVKGSWEGCVWDVFACIGVGYV